MTKQQFKVLVNMDNSIKIYQTADGENEIKLQFDGDTLWFSQAQLSELFGKDVRTINEHIKNVFDEGEFHFTLPNALSNTETSC